MDTITRSNAMNLKFQKILLDSQKEMVADMAILKISSKKTFEKSGLSSKSDMALNKSSDQDKGASEKGFPIIKPSTKPPHKAHYKENLVKEPEKIENELENTKKIKHFNEETHKKEEESDEKIEEKIEEQVKNPQINQNNGNLPINNAPKPFVARAVPPNFSSKKQPQPFRGGNPFVSQSQINAKKEEIFSTGNSSGV